MNEQTLKRLITTVRLLDANCLHSEARAIESIVKRASSGDDLLPIIGGGEDSLWTSELPDEKSFDPFSHLGAEDERLPEINVDEDCVLTFGTSNSKLSHLGTTSFSLPAGFSCPFAEVCKSKVPREGGKIKDYGDIRCFQTSLEGIYPNVREARWKNFDLVKGKSPGEVTEIILKSIRYHEKEVRGISIMRIHDSGDFFSQAYFDGWVEAARRRSDIVFYAYTKSIPYWKMRKDDIPPNLRLIASEGGTKDDEIEDEFRRAVIVSGVDEAIERELNIDVNEFLALFGEGDFALLIHGNQPKGQMIGDEKATSVARANGKLIKELAKKNRLPASTIRRLIERITDAAQAEYDKSTGSLK